MAERESIDLFDKAFDWSVKAMTIQCFPEFYDFFSYQYFNPFNKRGEFNHVKSYDKSGKITEQEIYSMAPFFRFRANPK